MINFVDLSVNPNMHASITKKEAEEINNEI